VSVKRSGKLNGVQARIENGAKEGLILGGDLIAQRAQRRARKKTGRMARSITRGNPFRTARGMAISVGSNLSYFPAHELGSGDKSENPAMSKDPTRPGITAQPMVRPAIKESKKEVAILVAKRVISRMVRR
jgi:hypothetical protein